MKKLALLFLGFLFSLQVYSQTMYEKYNSYLNRYEYFNTYGDMIGYKTYDRYTKAWAYYKVEQTDNDMHLTETAKYIGSIQAQLQARYDYNYKRLTTAIEALQYKVNNSNYSNFVKKSTIDYFNLKCIKEIPNTNVNLTDMSQTTTLIRWLNESMVNFMNFYIEQENKSKN